MYRDELKQYLDKTKSEIYMVKFYDKDQKKTVTIPVHFQRYEGYAFERCVEVRRCAMTEQQLLEDIHDQYDPEYWEEAFEREKKNLIDGYWYEVDYPQCLPFLPNKIISIKPISERDYLLQCIEKWKQRDRFYAYLFLCPNV